MQSKKVKMQKRKPIYT